MARGQHGFAIACVVTALVAAACTSDDDAGGGEPTSADETSAGTEPPPTTDAATPDTAASTATVDTTDSDDGAYSAKIQRTTDGVPHITADSFDDVVFGQGYASAEDHACDLADQVHKVYGRRASIVGPGDDNEHIESDMQWKALGLVDTAVTDYADASDEIVAMFEAFAAGWSSFVEEVGTDGLSGWCAGADWIGPLTGEEIYTYSRAITLFASGTNLAEFIVSATPPEPADPADTEDDDVGGEPDDIEEDGEAAAPVSGPTRVALERMGDGLTSIASNGWALGTDAVEGGTGGMLVANPHFPWEGERRFWESHLIVPGELDIYGAMLIGLPGIGIGFSDSFAWTHTVSDGHRFTAYTLDLDPEDPTRYLVDGESRPMKSTELTVEVLQDDGSLAEETRTVWSSEYGPIIDFPGVGWTAERVLTYRDANVDNDEFVDQYRAMATAGSFDEFVEAHREHQGVPLFNTIATSSDGRAWYADTSATPNLSAEAEQLYAERLQSDPITQIAADNHVVLLDGSDSRFQWEEVPGSRDPGLVPFDEMPMVERADYVFNANDSFWMPHATEMLEGEYSVLHGAQGTERSARTRENAFVLSGADPDSPAGEDGRFNGEELRNAAFFNLAGTSRLLREPVAERCAAAGTVDVPTLDDEAGNGLAAGTVDLTPACDVLVNWDGKYELDSRGAVLWREFITAARRDLEGGMSGLWAEPFDPARPLETPAGLVPPPDDGSDPVLVALARSVQTLEVAGHPVDVTLGELQYAPTSVERIPLHGGTGLEGVPNVVGYADPSTTLEPRHEVGEPFVTGSDLRPDGYPVGHGTSFIMNVDYTGGAVEAWAILTYGESGDPVSPQNDAQTQRFSDKNWRRVAFTADDIANDPELTETEVTGG